MISFYSVVKTVSRVVDGRKEVGDLWKYDDCRTRGYRVSQRNERGYSEKPEGICGFPSQKKAVEMWRRG